MEKKSCPGCDRMITPLTGGGLRVHGPVGNRCTQVPTPASTPTPECTCPAMERKYYGGDKPHHPGCAIRKASTPKEGLVWAVATKGWDLHIVRHGKALCERPVSSVRLTDRESDNKLVANKLTRKCFGCTEIYNQEENTMPTLDKRVTTGPLTSRQKYILSQVARGHQHAEIGEELSLSRTAVAEDMRVVVAKLKVKNSAEAVMVYGRHAAYLEASRLLEEGLIVNPGGDGEEHVNHVLEGYARQLRALAYQTIPE